MIERIADAMLHDVDAALDGALAADPAKRAKVQEVLAAALREAVREVASGTRERAFRAARGVAYDRTKSNADAEARGADAAAEAIRALDVEPPDEAP